MIIDIYAEGNFEKAKTGWVSEEDDHTRRHGAIRPCVDGFLEYAIDGKKGILLAYRDNVPPAANQLWVPGGDWKRGILNPVEALRLKIKEETNLDISDEEYLGIASMFWNNSPYDSDELKEDREKRHLGEGIHDIGHAFFAKASGDLKLKTMAPPVILVNSQNFEEISEKYELHDYIKKFIKEALKRMK